VKGEMVAGGQGEGGMRHDVAGGSLAQMWVGMEERRVRHWQESVSGKGPFPVQPGGMFPVEYLFDCGP
jgi:hypothetical protein